MRCRPVLMFDVIGNFIKEFDSIKDIAAYLNKSQSSVIYESIKKNNIIDNKYICIFKDSFNLFTFSFSSFNKRNIYLCLDKDGNYIKTYYNADDLKKDGFIRKHVSKAAAFTLSPNNVRKKGYLSKGFIFVDYFRLSKEDKEKVIKNKLIQL